MVKELAGVAVDDNLEVIDVEAARPFSRGGRPRRRLTLPSTPS
jgi:hypothetical protein